MAKLGKIPKNDCDCIYQKRVVCRKNLDINKKDKINFVVSINSSGKILWSIQLGGGCLSATMKT